MTRIIGLLLLLSACSDSREVLDELPNSSLAGAPRVDVPESRMDAPVARAVTIGEDGPRMDACGGMGEVTRAGATGLAVHAAPFTDARVLIRLAEGSRAIVCTRSIDQKWLGVVVTPLPVLVNSAPDNSAAQGVDCGVSSPVDRKQPYAGPCVSGWVASAYIRLVAG